MVADHSSQNQVSSGEAEADVGAMSHGADQVKAKPHRVLAAIELALVTLGMLVIVWRPWEWWGVVGFIGQMVMKTLPPFVVGLVVAFALLRDRDKPGLLGLSSSNWKRGWLSAATMTLPALLVLLLAGTITGSLDLSQTRLQWLLSYAHGLVAQQLLLQSFFMTRTEQVFQCGNTNVSVSLANESSAHANDTKPSHDNWPAIALASVVFAVMHLPNPVLCVLTILAGLVWTWHFQRYRNLPVLLLSHLLLGAVAMLSLGDGLLLDLAVGYPAWLRLTGQ